jgi:hypothetical protein
MFVDDIILFGIGNIVEWKEYKKILELFCKATGMAFSPQKSSFLEVGWTIEEIEVLKEILPFDVKPVDEGFKYLGCFLKPNCYNKTDWSWLEKKFETRISNWSHRWLSLGGRYTLVKVVLESIPVYWLSLAKIPKSILNNIRKRMFNFLWTGKKIKEGVHLINWRKIAKPKKVGGWGIKNIFFFGKALAAKSLWRCLNVPGLWNEVILKKYIRKKSVVDWLREGKKNWSGISNTWRALISSLDIVTDWLAWKLGNGRDIRIGTDPMVGAHRYYKLSRNLLQTLKIKGIEFLAQAWNLDMEVPRNSNWKNVEFLGLEGVQQEEWNNFIKGLLGSGIDLNAEKDSLLWSWDTKRGQVNAKQAYEVQLLEEEVADTPFWYSDLWQWQIPLKVKLFTWLVLEHKILTWENLVKRGIVGPSKCVLCGNKEENINHLFVDCDFSKEIWYNIQKQLKSEGKWEGGHISDCFQNWIEKKDNIKELPSYICWEIWKQRNLAIFEDRIPNRNRVCNNIYQDLGDIKVSLPVKGSRIDRPPLIDWDMAVGFFDGASQDRGTKCGAGAVIKCPILGTYRLKMNCGNGTEYKG